jgi:hypothetical protein
MLGCCIKNPFMASLTDVVRSCSGERGEKDDGVKFTLGWSLGQQCRVTEICLY